MDDEIKKQKQKQKMKRIEDFVFKNSCKRFLNFHK